MGVRAALLHCCALVLVAMASATVSQPKLAQEPSDRIIVKWTSLAARHSAAQRMEDLGLQFSSTLTRDESLTLFTVADGTPGDEKLQQLLALGLDGIKYAELDAIVSIQPVGGFGMVGEGGLGLMGEEGLDSGYSDLL